MIDWLVEAIRGRRVDQAKARKYLADRADETFRETVAEYDTFVSHMLDVKEPALGIGRVKDSLGYEIPARLELKDVACNWVIQGSPGSGKTSFATHMLAEMLSQGWPIGVVDCKAEFFDAALRWTGAVAWSMNEPERNEFVRSLTVINPFSDSLVPFNVCRLVPGSSPEAHVYDVTAALSRLFPTEMSFYMESVLRHLLLLLIEARLSLVEAPLVLRDEVLRGILAERSNNVSVKNFFFRTYPELPSVSKDRLIVRLESLLLAENLRLMLGADELVDIKGALDRGDPIFAFLGKGPGVPEEQVEIFGSLILQLLFQAAFSGGKRHPYQLILDEFFHLLEAPALERRFETALTSLRSYGVTLTLIMHNFSQISTALREIILGSSDIMAIFRTSSRNAQFFGDFVPQIDPGLVAEKLRKSGQLPTKQETQSHLMEQIQRLPNRHCYFYDRKKPYRAILLRVPDLCEPHEAVRVSARELEEFIQTNGVSRGGFALSKDVLRRQIDAREKRLTEIVSPPIRVQASGPNNLSTSEANETNGKKKRKPRLG